eukprot:1915579-Pyramimonas_sp.AAC.1
MGRCHGGGAEKCNGVRRNSDIKNKSRRIMGSGSSSRVLVPTVRTFRLVVHSSATQPLDEAVEIGLLGPESSFLHVTKDLLSRGQLSGLHTVLSRHENEH